MAYEIIVHELATAELEELRVVDERRVVDEIKNQLRHEPTVVTRNRKRLKPVAVSFEHEPPLWELRVGVFRVFYDVSEDRQQVHIRAVRRKDPRRRTKDIL